MADDLTSGLASAVEAAVADQGARLPLTPAEDLDLFTDLEASRRSPVQAARDAIDEARARGRPRGSPNRRTLKWRDYLASRYAHPLEVLAQTITRTPAELAAELGCSTFEAFTLQQRAAAELAPYMESKMPVLAHVALDSGVTLLMPGLNAPLGASLADLEAMAIDPTALDFEVLPSPGAIEGEVVRKSDG